nr:DUF4431 domain-containing protein [uncultured Duganella sp.]
MKIRPGFAGILLCGAICCAARAADCLNYEPDTVTLVGELHRATFPGKPDFDSIDHGDEPETGFYLSLNPAICTRGKSAGDQQAHDGVQEVQLVLTPEQYAALRPRLGGQVELQGRLFAAFSGHHHADVLLRVDRAPSN